MKPKLVVFDMAGTTVEDLGSVNRCFREALAVVGRTEEARKCFDRALEILSSHPEALFNVGDLLFFSGNSVDAEQYYSNAVAARPLFAEGYMALGRACFDADQFDRALQCFDRMIQAAEGIDVRIFPHSHTA